MKKITVDRLVASAEHGITGATTAEMSQPAFIAHALKMILGFMLDSFQYRTDVEDGPSIVARMVAMMVWRLEHPAALTEGAATLKTGRAQRWGIVGRGTPQGKDHY